MSVEAFEVKSPLICRHQMIDDGSASRVDLEIVAKQKQHLRSSVAFDIDDDSFQVAFHVSSMLGHPHLVFFTPDIIGLPDFEPDGELAAGLGNENSFVGMRHIDACNDKDFFRNPFIDENAVSLPHRYPRVSFSLHWRKVTIAKFARQMHAVSIALRGGSRGVSGLTINGSSPIAVAEQGHSQDCGC